jgi:hypothetical protein
MKNQGTKGKCKNVVVNAIEKKKVAKATTLRFKSVFSFVA